MIKVYIFKNIKCAYFFMLEVLLFLLKLLYYICEVVYKYIVPRKKKSVTGEVVLITGAGRGIGKELAIGYASLGATVVCWDINHEINMQTVTDIKRMGKTLVYGYQCDVSKKDEVFKVAKKMKEEVGDVTILINNAGIAPIRTFLDYSNDQISSIINTNFIAQCWTIKAFLPNMIEKNHGHIVAISSIIAVHGGMHSSLYGASKSAVRLLMQSIKEEVRKCSNGKSSVKFTTILPGLVYTELSKTQKFRFPHFFGGYSAQEAAKRIINAQSILPDKIKISIIDFCGFMFDEVD